MTIGNDESAALRRADRFRFYLTLLPRRIQGIYFDAIDDMAAYHPLHSTEMGTPLFLTMLRHAGRHFGEESVAQDVAVGLATIAHAIEDETRILTGHPTTEPWIRLLRAEASPVLPTTVKVDADAEMPAAVEWERSMGISMVGMGTTADPGAVLDRMDRLSALAAAGGRWRGDRPPSQARMAGDAVALMAVFGDEVVGRMQEGSYRTLAWDPDGFPDAMKQAWNAQTLIGAVLLHWLGSSEPFWIPTGFAAAVLDSRPFDSDDLDHLRLPHRFCFVGFADPVVVGVERHPFDVVDKADYWLRAERSGDCRLPDEPLVKVPLSVAAAANTCQVDALVLRSDDEGRLLDGFAWCLTIPTSDGKHVYARAMVPAQISLTDYAPLVRNAAALVAWGDWCPPGDFVLPADPDSREFHKAVKRGAFRRAERSGAAGHVRVLDIERSAARAKTTSDDQSGRTVAPHTRRGHWRRSRIGPRDDWETHRTYRVNWIPPTWVNAHLGDDAEVRVYRVKPQSPAGTGAEGS